MSGGKLERIGEIYGRGKPVFSFEFFPPKTDQGARNLMRTAADLKDQVEPDFISVTHGAGGTTRDRTHAVVTQIQDDLGITGLAHLTCVGSTAEEIGGVVRRLEAAGVRNVLALRGDPPSGADVSGDLPTAPSGGDPTTEPPSPLIKALPLQGSAHIPSPPIKLRIRRSFHEGTLCSRSSPLPHEQPLPVPTHSVAPPPSLPVSAAAAFAPTRFGRAKTKGDIKKQLMEKKRDRKMQDASRDAAIKQEVAVREHLIS